MPTVLLTAFKPFGHWTENSSWLCLQELMRETPYRPGVVTRLYPVDFAAARALIARDLQSAPDYAIHLGQAAESSSIHFERIALNLADSSETPDAAPQPLEPDGPLAFASRLPLEDWARGIREQGIPARVSHHAGIYLCNALLYWTHYLAARDNLPTRAAFIHLPLAPRQTLQERRDVPSMSETITATAVRWVLDQLLGEETSAQPPVA